MSGLVLAESVVSIFLCLCFVKVLTSVFQWCIERGTVIIITKVKENINAFHVTLIIKDSVLVDYIIISDGILYY